MQDLVEPPYNLPSTPEMFHFVTQVEAYTNWYSPSMFSVMAKGSCQIHALGYRF